MNITKKKQTHRSREQISAYQWGEGRWEGGNVGVRDLEAQTSRYKRSYKDILYNMENIANIL